MDDKRKDHFDPERPPPKRNHPQQLQTHNAPRYNVENTYGAIQGDLPYLPTPPLWQDMTQGQFLSGV